MQLDPEISFSTQINTLSGSDFEKIVAASMYYSGYHIDRNLIFGLNKETVAEIDIVASLITPLNEIRIAIECKGSNPSFNDLRKFASVSKLLSLKEYLVELILFGSNNTRPEHNEIAYLLNIKLLKKEDLSKLVLPILWGTGELRKERTT
jgi:predicted RecB family endonuclease